MSWGFDLLFITLFGCVTYEVCQSFVWLVHFTLSVTVWRAKEEDGYITPILPEICEKDVQRVEKEDHHF